MFNDIIHLQSLNLMPLTSVTDCTDSNGDPTVGAASTKWPGTDLILCICADSGGMHGPAKLARQHLGMLGCANVADGLIRGWVDVVPESGRPRH